MPVGLRLVSATASRFGDAFQAVREGAIRARVRRIFLEAIERRFDRVVASGQA
jgi:hypothetical protein